MRVVQAVRMDGRLDEAVAAIQAGELVVYPTETVYGLGADALSPAAIEQVYSVKRRSRDNPLSFAVPDISTALEYVAASETVRAFMEAFLPGPVTVVCEATRRIPRELTAGKDRVGVRIPDHVVALELLEGVSPVTSTSANISGRGSITRVDDLDPEVRAAVAVVVDGGETSGGASTVVDPERKVIHRRGVGVNAVEAWLEGR